MRRSFIDVATVFNQYGIGGSLRLSREVISLKAHECRRVDAKRIGYGSALLG
jgi:hypothetical protein